MARRKLRKRVKRVRKRLRKGVKRARKRVRKRGIKGLFGL